jgi:hypothetical protein
VQPNTVLPREIPYGHDGFDVPELDRDNAPDHAIDKLVYESCGLTEDEIRIVEGKQ